MAGKRTSSMLLSPRSYLTRSQNSIRVCHIFCEPPPGVYQRLRQAAISLYNYFFSPPSLPSAESLTAPDTPPAAPTYSKPFPRPSPALPKARERRESAVQTNPLDFPRNKRSNKAQGEPPLPAKKRKVHFPPCEAKTQPMESLFNPQEMERLKTGSCSAQRFLARMKRVGTRSASPHESDLSCPTTPEPEGRYMAEPVSPEPVTLPAAQLTAPPSLAIQPTIVAPLQPATSRKAENVASSPPLFDILSSAATSVPPTSPAQPASPMKLASELRSPSPPPPQKPILEITPSPQPSIHSFSTALPTSDLKPAPPTERYQEEAKLPPASTAPFPSNPFLSPLPTPVSSYKFVFGAQSSPEKPAVPFTPQVSTFSLPQDTEMATEQHGAPAPFFPGSFAAVTAPIPASVPDFGAGSQLSLIGNFGGGPAVFGSAGSGQAGGFSLGVVKKRQR